MSTIAQQSPASNVYHAILHDTPGVLGKVDGVVYFMDEGGTMTVFEPDMINFCVVLGRADLAETQCILDTLHGGAARICTQRAQEVR